MHQTRAVIRFRNGKEQQGTVTISQDLEMPDIVSLGERMFILDGYSYEGPGQEYPIYTEARWGLVLTLDGREAVLDAP